jgi:hypothetical protein
MNSLARTIRAVCCGGVTRGWWQAGTLPSLLPGAMVNVSRFVECVRFLPCAPWAELLLHSSLTGASVWRCCWLRWCWLRCILITLGCAAAGYAADCYASAGYAAWWVRCRWLRCYWRRCLLVTLLHMMVQLLLLLLFWLMLLLVLP